VKLLVPIDGSEVGARALAISIDLARAHPGSSLHVVAVHPKPIIYGEVAIYVGRERSQALATEHDRKVLALVLPQLENAGVPYTTHSEEGEVAPTIARLARELGCQQIVMGTRGLGRSTAFLMGSVATQVVHLADVPVTLVK